MRLSEFDYNLPEKLIAQHPAERRDKSRLLVLNKDTGNLSHHIFSDIARFFEPGDLLIMNNTRVFPARLFGRKELTGGKVELLLQKQLKDNVWETIGKGLRVGVRIKFDGSSLEASVLQKNSDVYEIFFNLDGQKFYQELERIGNVPLPPYIKREANGPKNDNKRQADIDRERYQTIYAKEQGSVAAPTAGLHFTPELLRLIVKKGVSIQELTLHVGLGTFAPVKCEEIEHHKMHKEYFSVPRKTIEKIIQTKKEGGRVIAVGTTTVRVLETLIAKSDWSELLRQPDDVISGSTDIFIYPPRQIKSIDGMITNFHLPKSTLLMLISAFAGKEKIFNAYREAVRKEYRFFSYGDAMLII